MRFFLAAMQPFRPTLSSLFQRRFQNPNMTEHELINGCLKNDQTAQRQLYDRYKQAMYTLAYRMTGDFDAANDVLQDAFLDVFRSLSQFRQEATLGAWIKAIVVRRAYRKSKQPKAWKLPDQLPTENDGVDWGNDNTNAQHLEEAVLLLPEGFRTVFVLVEVEGYLHREVAEMLGITEGTSKSQLFHAKKRLRDILTKNPENKDGK